MKGEGSNGKKVEGKSLNFVFKGALIAVHRLSREDSRVKLQLMIEARDHGTPPLASTAPMIIKIEGADKNAPKFLQSIYRVNVTENLSIGSFVTQLNAIDESGGKLGLKRGLGLELRTGLELELGLERGLVLGLD